MKVAVLVSGGGTNLQALIDAKKAGKLKDAELELVISSSAEAFALKRAEKAGIRAEVISKKNFASEAEYDKAMIDAVESVKTDPKEEILIVLAGFLTRLGENFVRHFEGRIINIHPSLIPSFCGKGFYGIKPHIAVLETGCRVTGATVHIVDSEYDHGKILAQKAVYVKDGDSPESLQKRVMEEAERIILPETVDKMTRGEK